METSRKASESAGLQHEARFRPQREALQIRPALDDLERRVHAVRHAACAGNGRNGGRLEPHLGDLRQQRLHFLGGPARWRGRSSLVGVAAAFSAADSSAGMKGEGSNEAMILGGGPLTISTAAALRSVG